MKPHGSETENLIMSDRERWLRGSLATWLNTFLLLFVGFLAQQAYTDIRVQIKSAIDTGISCEHRLAVNDEKIRGHDIMLQEIKQTSREMLSEIRKNGNRTN
jgi:predicted NACHT family NTPase